MKNIGIIGGGIIGLCSAYYLNKSGHRVTVLDQGDMTDGCSRGNAGMIVPSHFIPLAAPGMIAKGIRWMFNSRSPFYVHPRLSSDLIAWGYHFYRSATAEHVQRSIPALKDISLLSKDRYRELSRELPFDFGYQERGLMMLYQTAASEREETETARLATKHGLEVNVLNGAEVQQMEPEAEVKVRGGIYFPGDAHLLPHQLMSGLHTHLKNSGMQFQTNVKVTGFRSEGSKVKSILTQNQELTFDEIILAAGSWSGQLARQLGLSLPMQAGKGYSFNMERPQAGIRIPSILLEARVAVTPMGNSIRFGGTMEIGALDPSVNMRRVSGIVEAIPKYYPMHKIGVPEKESVWYGFRPCSPDGLPYIGRLKKLTNVVIATGHSMMGLSLGPGTGKLVSEIVNEEKAGMNLQPFSPARFG